MRTAVEFQKREKALKREDFCASCPDSFHRQNEQLLVGYLVVGSFERVFSPSAHRKSAVQILGYQSVSARPFSLCHVFASITRSVCC
jgi:hypothetical protein